MRELTRRLSVSKSSVSLWVRDLPLTAEQRARLEAENALHGRQLRGAAENARKSRLARIRWQDEGWDRARNGDPLFAAGCMPYWGEGRKTRNAAQITNSDPEVLGAPYADRADDLWRDPGARRLRAARVARLIRTRRG